MQSLDNFRTPDSNKTLGIELEVLLSANGPYYGHGRYCGFFYVTTDGSIRYGHDQYGREFVSQPLTPRWLKKEIKKLGTKVQWTHNDSCGIHIHVSRAWLTDAKAKKIHDFYCSLTNEQRFDLFGRGVNEYTRNGQWKTTRYNAVNMENSATIEFRMFASGTAHWAQCCVDMAVWMINNANHLNIDAAYAALEVARKENQ